MNTIFEAIRAEHESMRTMLNILDKTHGDSRGRQELFERFKHLHNNHAAAEERALYNKMLGDKGMRSKTRHSIAEHKEADELIEKLDDMEFTAPQWILTFRELKKEVEHHLKEEEQEVFALAREQLSEDECESLARRFHGIRANQD